MGPLVGVVRVFGHDVEAALLHPGPSIVPALTRIGSTWAGAAHVVGVAGATLLEHPGLFAAAIFVAIGLRPLGRRLLGLLFGHLATGALMSKLLGHARFAGDQPVVLTADTGRRRVPHLSSPRLRLRGRPDVLEVYRDNTIRVIEYKSRQAGLRPAEGDVMQLVAYMVLIEEGGGRVRPGILRYSNRDFTVELTDELRLRLNATVEEIRAARAGVVGEARPTPNKCAECPVLSRCQEGQTMTARVGSARPAPRILQMPSRR